MTETFLGLSPTAWGAIFTFVIAGFAFWQVWVYREMRDHNKTIQRAYIDLSHTAPGLRPDGKGGFLLTLTIKNNGKTPGDIVGGKIHLGHTDKQGYQWVRLNEIAKIPHAFINPGDVLTMNDLVVAIPTPTPLTVWIIGDVYYRDRFSDLYEAGYGRRYMAGQVMNLVFDESTTGLNYDRSIKNPKFDKFGEFEGKG